MAVASGPVAAAASGCSASREDADTTGVALAGAAATAAAPRGSGGGGGGGARTCGGGRVFGARILSAWRSTRSASAATRAALRGGAEKSVLAEFS